MLRISNVHHSARCTALANEEVAELCRAYHFLCEREPDLDLINYDYRSRENAAIWRKTRTALFLDEYEKLGEGGMEGADKWVVRGEGR